MTLPFVLELCKIRSPEGLYSYGGLTPRWGKRGKTWKGLGPLKSHLRLLLNEREERDQRKGLGLYVHGSGVWPYEGCEVVTMRYGEASEKVISVSNVVRDMNRLRRGTRKGC